MPEADVEQLLVSLILDNRVQGHIDQVNRLLECGDRLILILHKLFAMFQKYSVFMILTMQIWNFVGDRSKGMKKYTAVEKWNTQLRSLYQSVSNRVG